MTTGPHDPSADPDHGALIRVAPGGAARIRRIQPNPAGQLEALFVIDGDFVTRSPDILHAADPSDVPDTAARASGLRIFHVNDMHNHLFDTDSTGRVTHRLAQMVRIVRDARDRAGPDEAVLFLSAGDDHTGTLLDELVGWTAEGFDVDPSYQALSAAGLDAAALGNHEFDRGAAQLALGTRDATFPLLSANIHSSAHVHPGEHYHAALLAEVKGLRVGIIGLTTRVETRTGLPTDPTLAVASPVDVLHNILPLIDRISDVVLILSHCGYGDGSHVSGKASTARDIGEADFALADAAAKIASKPIVIVGAHTHTTLNEDGVDPANLRSGVLITQAGANGRFLGEIFVDATGHNPIKATLHPVAPASEETDTNADRDFAQRHIVPLISRIETVKQRVIGQVQSSALSWADTRASRYTAECGLANFMNDAIVEQLSTLPGDAVDLAFLNGGSILAGVEPGPLQFGQWFDVMPYSDEVFVTQMTGLQIEEVLQSNARRILRPEETERTDVDGFVARGFLHASSALRYRIDLGDSAATAKAGDIELFGTPLSQQHSRRFNVAMTTYLALGSFGERWTGAPLSGGIPGNLSGYDLRGMPSRNTGLVYRSLLVDFIQRHAAVRGPLDGRLQVY